MESKTLTSDTNVRIMSFLTGWNTIYKREEIKDQIKTRYHYLKESLNTCFYEYDIILYKYVVINHFSFTVKSVGLTLLRLLKSRKNLCLDIEKSYGYENSICNYNIYVNYDIMYELEKIWCEIKSNIKDKNVLGIIKDFII